MTELAKKRPEFRNINALTDLPSYRLPAAGIVSILHRVSGVLMFLRPLEQLILPASLSDIFSKLRKENNLLNLRTRREKVQEKHVVQQF